MGVAAKSHIQPAGFEFYRIDFAASEVVPLLAALCASMWESNKYGCE